MKRSRRRSRCCPNPDCFLRGQASKGNIIRHSFYITSQGRRRRYRCKECGRTFSSTHGTPYYRLHKPRSLFDEVVRMCVHGIAISTIVQIKHMAWGTVARWLESAATYAVRFNDRMHSTPDWISGLFSLGTGGGMAQQHLPEEAPVVEAARLLRPSPRMITSPKEPQDTQHVPKGKKLAGAINGTEQGRLGLPLPVPVHWPS